MGRERQAITSGVRTVRPRPRPRQWREILADALNQQGAINVRATVTDHLRRTPTRPEITAARRAAHGLAHSGHAVMFHIRPEGLNNGRGSGRLILARPEIESSSSGVVDYLADDTFAGTTRRRFEPMVMAKDLASSVELLSAAIEALSTDRLQSQDAQRLLASVEASLNDLRRIRRHLRASILIT